MVIFKFYFYLLGSSYMIYMVIVLPVFKLYMWFLIESLPNHPCVQIFARRTHGTQHIWLRFIPRCNKDIYLDHKGKGHWQSLEESIYRLPCALPPMRDYKEPTLPQQQKCSNTCAMFLSREPIREYPQIIEVWSCGHHLPST